MITSSTKIYGSFSKVAGNNGCKYFNGLFQEHNIDAIYKSFSVDSITDAINAAKLLKFSGFAISSPYKRSMATLCDTLDFHAHKSWSVNTVLVSEHGLLHGFNTDYFGVHLLLYPYALHSKPLYILGNGGLANTVKHAADQLHITIGGVITRENWPSKDEIQNSIIFNCTPTHPQIYYLNNVFIDCHASKSRTGEQLYYEQAKQQFKLYTGITFNGE